MNGDERRKGILRMLKNGSGPVSGTELAKLFNVSRQVIVQDIALMRANGYNIYSTNRGYLIVGSGRASRVFKIKHLAEETEEELMLIINYGGRVEDVFIYHKVYGIMRGELNLGSAYDVQRYMHDISNGRSSLLMNITSGYHYHTVTADSEAILDMIQSKLQERGFLAQLQDYEPVDFWENRKIKQV